MKKLVIALAVLATLIMSSVAMAEVKMELYYYKQEIRDALQEMVNAFMSANPDIKVEMTMIPNEGLTVLKTRFASGQAPDIIQMQSYSQIFEFAAAGYLLDLTAEPVLAKVIDSSKGAVTYQGKVYSLPTDFAGIGIIYNNDLLTKAGVKNPPTTLKELEDTCAALKQAGILPFSGLLRANWSVGHFISMVHTSLMFAKGGQKLFDEWFASMQAGTGSFIDPIKKNDLFRIMDFYKANMAENSVEWDWTEQQAAFAKGEAAMMVQGLWSYNAVLNNTEATINKDAVGFVPFPVTNDAAQTKFFADVDSTFGISAQSAPDKQAAAKKFLEWFATPEAVKMWTTKCNLTSTFKDADMSGMKKPFQELMAHVAKNGAYPWAFSMYPVAVFEDGCKTGAQEYFFGKKDADQVISLLNDLWKNAIGGK